MTSASASSFKGRDYYSGALGQSRFLILPWIDCRNLASKALALVGRRLRDDWAARYGIQPVLIETFVDTTRFAGTCYKAANWIAVGHT